MCLVFVGFVVASVFPPCVSDLPGYQFVQGRNFAFYRVIIYSTEDLFGRSRYVLVNYYSIMDYKLSATGGTLSPCKSSRAQGTQPNDALHTVPLGWCFCAALGLWQMQLND